MIAKNPAHIAFASFLSAEKMRFKMFLHLILALIGLHLFSTIIFLLLITQPPQLRISGLWLFSHAMTEINPDYQVIFPDSHGNFRTTVKTVAQSAEVGDYVQDYGRVLQHCFYLSASVYLLLPVLLFWFRHRSRKQLQAFHIRGSRLLTYRQLNKLMRLKREASSLPLGKVTMPRSAENKSVFILGRPGSGKSTALNQIIRKLAERQTKMLIYDFKGEYLEKFYDYQTDIIFNPLDSRSVTWNLFAEIRQTTDIDSIASSLIPPAHAHADPFWSDAARQVFSGILHYLFYHDFRTNADIWKMITSNVSTLREALLSVCRLSGNMPSNPIQNPT